MTSYNHTIVDGTSLAVSSNYHTYSIIRLTGTVVLTVNWAVTYSGTPCLGEQFVFRYTGKITLGGNHITILGASIPDEYASKDYNVTAIWNGKSWDVVVMPDFDEADIITTTHILNDAVTTSKILDLNVTTGKIAALAVDATKLAADSVTTTKILNSNVTLAKIADLTANTVLGNFTAGAAAPQEVTMAASTVLARLAAGNLKACSVAEIQTLLAVQTTTLTSARIWVGDGTNASVERTVSGAIAISNTGVTSYNDDTLTSLKVTQRSNVWGADGLVACAVVAGSDLKALLDGNSNTLISLLTSDIVVKVDFIVQTASGVVATVDIGPDAAVTGGVADLKGYIAAANSNAAAKYLSDNATYSGAYMDFGFHTAVGSGDITIISSADLSASAIVATALVYYIPK